MAKRYLGVDYGRERIGLAVADEDVKVARPWQILEPDGRSASKLISGLVTSEKVTDVIVGLPRGLDGQDTAQTTEVRQFVSQLEDLGLMVALQDEADTSQVARSQHPGQRHIDAAAAAIILQDYLENS